MYICRPSYYAHMHVLGYKELTGSMILNYQGSQYFISKFKKRQGTEKCPEKKDVKLTWVSMQKDNFVTKDQTYKEKLYVIFEKKDKPNCRGN